MAQCHIIDIIFALFYLQFCVLFDIFISIYFILLVIYSFASIGYALAFPCLVTRDAIRLARCVRFLQPAGSEATTVGRRCMADFSQLALKLPPMSRSIVAAACNAAAAASAAALM